MSLFGKSFLKGLQDYGMLATAKHFPGHGDTEDDSHSSLARIRVMKKDYGQQIYFAFPSRN